MDPLRNPKPARASRTARRGCTGVVDLQAEGACGRVVSWKSAGASTSLPPPSAGTADQPRSVALAHSHLRPTHAPLHLPDQVLL